MNSILKLTKDVQSIGTVSDNRTFARYLGNLMLSFPEVVRTKTVRSVNEKMKGGDCTFQISWGKSINLDGEFFGGAREIYCHQVYFALPGFTINENDCVVDLGANAGLFTTLAAIHGRKVISVEAQDGFIPIIESNLRKNNCFDKAQIEWGIIGNGKGVVSVDDWQSRASHYRHEPPTLEMEELLKKYKVEQVDFMKIDIEGSEYALFENHPSWLKKVRRIAMEVHCKFGDANELATLFKNNGFEVWLLDNDLRQISQFKPEGTSESGYIYAHQIGT